MEGYLKDMRNEAIWFHYKYKNCNGTQIAKIFNLHRSTAHEIIKKMPEGWETSWRKTK
jgi:transposase